MKAFVVFNYLRDEPWSNKCYYRLGDAKNAMHCHNLTSHEIREVEVVETGKVIRPELIKNRYGYTLEFD